MRSARTKSVDVIRMTAMTRVERVLSRKTRAPRVFGGAARETAPRDGARPERRLLGTIGLRSLERRRQATRAEAMGRPITAALRPEAQPTIGHDPAASDSAVLDEAAGQAAFETYGTSGARINPYRPGSHEQANWNKGFVNSAVESPARDQSRSD